MYVKNRITEFFYFTSDSFTIVIVLIWLETADCTNVARLCCTSIPPSKHNYLIYDFRAELIDFFRKCPNLTKYVLTFRHLQ